jgi:thymidine kinase
MAKLFWRFSAMNAGKSTMLLQIQHNYTSQGRKVNLLTAGLDDRFGVGQITSRLGLSKEADIFTSESDLFTVVQRYRDSVTADTLGAILIDEAQFLTPEQVQALHRAVHQLKIPVMCFGLRSDFKGNAFPGAAMLGVLAEDVEEVKTVCACGRKATMNMRIDAEGKRVTEGPQVEIGDARYRQVCGSCFYC